LSVFILHAGENCAAILVKQAKGLQLEIFDSTFRRFGEWGVWGILQKMMVSSPRSSREDKESSLRQSSRKLARCHCHCQHRRPYYATAKGHQAQHVSSFGLADVQAHASWFAAAKSINTIAPALRTRRWNPHFARNTPRMNGIACGRPYLPPRPRIPTASATPRKRRHRHSNVGQNVRFISDWVCNLSKNRRRSAPCESPRRRIAHAPSMAAERWNMPCIPC
jgi:hypothetical protein